MSTDDLILGNLTILAHVFNLKKIILLIISVGFLFLLAKALKILSNNICNRIPTRRVVIFQVTTILTFMIHIIGGSSIIYLLLKPPKELMLALLGSATVAIGFALKDIAGSFISGLTMIMDPPFQVGDRVKFNDFYGEIVQIGLRAVRLLTLDAQIVTIPNIKFINEAVLNNNRGKLNMNVCITFYVSIHDDINNVHSILQEVVATSRYAYLNEPVNMALEQVWKTDILCFELILKAHVIDAKFEKAFQADVYSRGVAALLESGVKIPCKKLDTQQSIQYLEKAA